MGENIKENQSTDNCTSATISCANSKGNAQIRIKTNNKCSKHLQTEIRDHANISEKNDEKLEDKMDDLEALLQIFLNKTGVIKQSMSETKSYAYLN